MIGYWLRHRLAGSIIISVTIAVIVGYLFAFSYISRKAENYNNQSIYKNTKIDYIAPEPSFEQVENLPGTNGIEKVFPYYLTKTDVTVNGKKRFTTVLLSDQFENIELTMYNSKRIIKKSNSTYDNPVFVDWQFYKDTSASIGDVISFSINGESMDFTITGIFETNTIYKGGAILARISDEQKKSIDDNSSNNGYSGMYISASEYGICQAYLTSDYRPLGRLKSREQFENEEQYQVHYDAIMSSGYSNEITNFRIRESSAKKKDGFLMIVIGTILSIAVLLSYNIVMTRRGCEKVYFLKHCIPKGINVKPYYYSTFILESILLVVIYVATLVVSCILSDEFIPVAIYDIKLAIIPISFILAEIICLIYNCMFVSNDSYTWEAER